jgi:hypothetical protein
MKQLLGALGAMAVWNAPGVVGNAEDCGMLQELTLPEPVRPVM